MTFRNLRMTQSVCCPRVLVVTESPVNLIPSLIRDRNKENDPFFIADLGDVVQKVQLWRQQLPRVEPFYAVKCNSDEGLLYVLNQLGIGFDCVSQHEINTILSMGVSPHRIIYANPCKQNSHIQFAAKHNVSLMTFDNMTELSKIKKYFPEAKLVVRIKVSDANSIWPLGSKFGCEPSRVPQLLKNAMDHNLQVVGVSFHVGSGCYDTTAFPAAIASARAVFDIGKKMGYDFELLDIGGGFPGAQCAKVCFEDIVSPLRQALDLHFPDSLGVRIIAEPGCYMAASAFTRCVNIIAKRAVTCDGHHLDGDGNTGSHEPKCQFAYYMNDGVYGSFRDWLQLDHVSYRLSLVNPEKYTDSKRFSSRLWGPTGDSIDCILQEVLLPELECGDWLVFHDMGAYTSSIATNYSGMQKPTYIYLIHERFSHQVNLSDADRQVTASPDIIE